MPKIKDVLCLNVKDSSGRTGEWYIKFAHALKMDLQQAKNVFGKYGNGYIYTSTGFAMPDRAMTRCQMVQHFGTCVVVTSDGAMFVRTTKHIGRLNRKERAVKKTVERRKVQSERMERRQVRETSRMFHDGAGVPCPKRGGKANSRSDMGKYVNYPNTRFSEWERRYTRSSK